MSLVLSNDVFMQHFLDAVVDIFHLYLMRPAFGVSLFVILILFVLLFCMSYLKLHSDICQVSNKNVM